MDTAIVNAARIFDSLTSRSGSVKAAAKKEIDNPKSEFDRASLRMMIINALSLRFPPPKPGEEDDPDTEDTRCWLLASLGRIVDDDLNAAEIVRKHLWPNFEPDEWTRYWVLEGLCASNPSDLQTLAKKIVEEDSGALPRSLATVILAFKGDDAALKIVQTNLSKKDTQWAMLRALRIVPLSNAKVVNKICEIVDTGGYEDTTYDAIVALGCLTSASPFAEKCAQTLANYLPRYRWPMFDSMRTKAIIGLAELGFERTAPVLIEELLDDNPAIVCEAARALEKVLGIRTAVGRILEATIKGRPDDILRYANALRWMTRSSIIDELETAMDAGSQKQQEVAQTLLSEVGGLQAFQKLRARTNVVHQYITALDETEKKVQQLFENSLIEAQKGFRLATIMDVSVFVVGVALLVTSGVIVLTKGGSLDEWAGVTSTVSASGGILGIVYSTLIAKPRKQVRESVDHLMHLKVVFLAYLRQLHQTDQAYARRMLESDLMTTSEIGEYSKIVGAILTEAIQNLTQRSSNIKFS